MSHFAYKNEEFHAEGVALNRIAEEVGTPFYCYSAGAIEDAYLNLTRALSGLDASIFYSVKANSNQAVIATLGRLGSGADVVSEGEMRRALAAGIAPRKIVFAGIGKSEQELAAALDCGILQINVESREELSLLSRIASQRGQKASIALRINPDVDAKTHRHITTGTAENKFGISIDEARELAAVMDSFPGVALEGLALHIGSQLTDVEPFRQAYRRVISLYREFQSQGLPLKRFDFGGGLGITYRDESPPDVQAYGRMIHEEAEGLDAELAFEPGRFVVGNAGILVSRVLYVKNGSERRFVILDAAMNDLLRPMLYEAWHDMLPVRQADPDAPMTPMDIVGPICESTDKFADQRDLPPLKAGDLIAICSTGAYSAVMASTYNSRLLAPEVMVSGDRFAVVRPRQDYADLIARDRLPDWLAAGNDSKARGAA